MYTQDNRQFSTKVKLPWPLISQYFDELTSQFSDEVENLFGSSARVTTRAFRYTCTARFTVIFPKWQKKPDATFGIVQTLVEKSTKAVIDKHKLEHRRYELC